ncbi:MAG: hypothetical protein P8P83_04725, partial [Rickettsiaceae bacterium]|nr:hypothetical protein [Rickettsiaceae bacterium]
MAKRKLLKIPRDPEESNAAQSFLELSKKARIEKDGSEDSDYEGMSDLDNDEQELTAAETTTLTNSVEYSPVAAMDSLLNEKTDVFQLEDPYSKNPLSNDLFESVKNWDTTAVRKHLDKGANTNMTYTDCANNTTGNSLIMLAVATYKIVPKEK